MARDDFTVETKQALAQRSGHHCSNPDCRRVTIGPADVPNKAVSCGVAAHIAGASPGGPRYDPSMTPAQRKDISNGVWLCATCSVQVDKDETRFPRALLQKWKRLSVERAGRRYYGFGSDIRIWGAVPSLPTGRLERVDLLDAVKARLEADGAVCLIGGPGIGKTILATSLVRGIASAYSFVAWLPASNQAHLEAAYVELGTLAADLDGRNDPGILAAAGRSWLSNQSAGLVVYDDVSMETIWSVDINKQNHMLLTSRDPRAAQCGPVVEVPPFSRAESVQVLRAGDPAAPDDAVSDLAERLGDVPLSVMHASIYMKMAHRSVHDFSALLAQEPRAVLASQVPLGQRSPINVIGPAIRQLVAMSAPAARILAGLAFVSTSGLPKWSVEASVTNEGSCLTIAQFDEAVMLLVANGLCTISSEWLGGGHDAVREVTRAVLDESSLADGANWVHDAIGKWALSIRRTRLGDTVGALVARAEWFLSTCARTPVADVARERLEFIRVLGDAVAFGHFAPAAKVADVCDEHSVVTVANAFSEPSADRPRFDADYFGVGDNVVCKPCGNYEARVHTTVRGATGCRIEFVDRHCLKPGDTIVHDGVASVLKSYLRLDTVATSLFGGLAPAMRRLLADDPADDSPQHRAT